LVTAYASATLGFHPAVVYPVPIDSSSIASQVAELASRSPWGAARLAVDAIVAALWHQLPKPQRQPVHRVVNSIDASIEQVRQAMTAVGAVAEAIQGAL
jgi:hypothetical protein